MSNYNFVVQGEINSSSTLVNKGLKYITVRGIPGETHTVCPFTEQNFSTNRLVLLVLTVDHVACAEKEIYLAP